MAFTVQDFEDLVRLLEEKPEWRERMRQLILTRELLQLPDLVRQLIESVQRLSEEFATYRQLTDQRFAELAEAQQRTEQRLQQLSEEFAAYRQLTDQRFAELAEAQQRTEQRLQQLSEEFAAYRQLTDQRFRRAGGSAAAYRATLAAVERGVRCLSPADRPALSPSWRKRSSVPSNACSS
jgi:chromosome segregation ATPase